MAYFDLDGFKGINDSLGHSTGDQVLLTVADTIKHRFRASDICVGSEEMNSSFCFPKRISLTRKLFSIRFMKNLNELAERQNWPLGFSIAVAVFQSPACSLNQAIRMADELMHETKYSGKNKVRYKLMITTKAAVKNDC